MNDFDEKQSSQTSSKNGAEQKFKARSVARGVAIGEVVCLHGKKRQYYKINLLEEQIEREVRRFKAAVRLAARQLKKIGSQPMDSANETKANIFDAHLLFLEDKSFLAKIENAIISEKINAEWSVKTITDEYISKYKAIADEYLRERYIDLEDVSERILTALGGGNKSSENLSKNAIIVAKEVKPSTLIELIEANPKAIVAEHGGWTSHTYILARELNLPAVTGIKGVLRRVHTGDKLIVDGYNGQIILNPTEETLNKYKHAEAQFEQINYETIDEKSGALKTLDGREIKIRANLDLPNGYKQAKQFGARGIGLYRSEFLFNQFKGFPSEAEQIKAYRKIAEMVGDEGIRIRTFDLSVEQLTVETEEKEKNPALGLRAIRLGLTHRKQFRTQLRAILQAAYQTRIDIVLPMISDVSEILETKKIIEAEKKYLKSKNINFGEPKLGAMIEVPAAVMIVDEIASEVEFLCLGTNDLVQYLLAVDRDNESVADWFRTLHPAVIRAVKMVIEAAENRGIPAIVCGEMAGSPYYAPILIGLGATELSMNVNSILRVRKIIQGIAFEEARAVVKETEKYKTADDIEKVVFEKLRKNWAHLFSEEFFRKN
jgi:phosphoenolpyruvate-protein phosphotransferase (PTS system enzyme I)